MFGLTKNIGCSKEAVCVKKETNEQETEKRRKLNRGEHGAAESKPKEYANFW